MDAQARLLRRQLCAPFFFRAACVCQTSLVQKRRLQFSNLWTVFVFVPLLSKLQHNDLVYPFPPRLTMTGQVTL